MKIKWLGWSSFKLNVGGKILYIDPFFGKYDEIGDIVLISHGHGDHSDLDVLSRIRNEKTVVLTSSPNAENVKGLGLNPGEKFDIADISISAVHAYNIVRMREPNVPFHPKGFGVGWIIEYSGKKIYFLGDTELIPEMNEINNIDVLFIPVSGRFVMDMSEAIETVKLIKPVNAIPMHYGTIDVVFGTTPMHIELETEVSLFKNNLEGITDVILLNHNEEVEL